MVNRRAQRRKMGKWGWLTAVLLLFAAGCAKHDTEGLAKVGRTLSERAATVIAELKDGLAMEGGGASLESRVRNRLRWDKNLAELAIEVKAKGGEIELSGLVPDGLLKSRAVELAETTAGVERVVDHLQVLDLNPTPLPAN